MAYSNKATNANRRGRSRDDEEDDDRGPSGGGRDACDDDRYDSHGKWDSHGKYESRDDDCRGDRRKGDNDCRGDRRKDDDDCRGDRGKDDDDRYECELDLDKRHDGIDLEVDVERDGKWLEVEIEIGSCDIDLKLDARHLQPDTTPVVSLLGGEGTAVGEETLVDAGIFCRLIDLGSVTIGFGTAKFSSAAVSDQDPAFAAATTFADVSGADFVFVFNKTISGSSDCGTSYASETSTTTYIAIDFEAFDFAEGQITLNVSDARSYLDGYGGYGGSRIPGLDGNVSMLDVDAQALGENTLVDVLTSILTIEDQLSSVSAVTVSAVG
jgi:hypothetical protein